MSKELNELIKHERIDEYGDTYTTYSGRKLDYLKSIAEEMNEKCENRNYNSSDRKFVKWDESWLRLDDEIWNKFRNYCVVEWEEYKLCNTCHSIIEEKVRKVLYPTQEEKEASINNRIKLLDEKINTITSNVNELHMKMNTILKQLSPTPSQPHPNPSP
jgi:hypothetical protein